MAGNDIGDGYLPWMSTVGDTESTVGPEAIQANMMFINLVGFAERWRSYRLEDVTSG